MYKSNDSLFNVAMGHGETIENLELINDMIDAEDAFEQIMIQVARTEFCGKSDFLDIKLALSALIGAWQCVTRARAAAGF